MKTDERPNPSADDREQVRRDARRYRWLRKTAEAKISVAGLDGSDSWFHAMFGERLDRHIDTALSAIEQQEGKP